MARKRVEHTPERDYVYTEKPTAPTWGTYRTPEERAAAQAASLKAANSPAAMRAKEVAEATAQAEALRAADRGTGWGAYRTPEERAAMIRAANNADKTVESSEPLNPHPLGAVDPIYQNQSNPTVRAAAQEAVSNKPMVSEDIMNEILNRKPFSYNAAADALYQQYKDQYLTAGNIAMKDTMGKAAALTGGYGNTYAQTVGQQVYDDYAARAADKIPELEQLAYERWAREGDELRNNYSLLYGREQDQAAADFEREKFKYQQSRDAVADQQWASEFGLKADAQKWAQYMDERQMTLNEAKFFLEQEIERGNLDIKKAQLALQKYETEQSVAQGWTKLDQSQQEINQGWTKIANDYALGDRELNMRENGTYFDRTSGSGSTAGDKTLLQIFNNKQDVLDSAVNSVVAMIRDPYMTTEAIAANLEANYGEDVGARLYELALQKSQSKDRVGNNSRSVK